MSNKQKCKELSELVDTVSFALNVGYDCANDMVNDSIKEIHNKYGYTINCEQYLEKIYDDVNYNYVEQLLSVRKYNNQKLKSKRCNV